MRASRLRPGRRLLAALPLVAALMLGCGGDGEEDATQAQTEACEEVAKPTPREVDLHRPASLAPPPTGTTAVIETSCGSFEFELDSRRAPRTAASFAYMVEEGVYEGTAIHRIVPGFVIQGGDPAGNGTGDAGYFVDEEPPQNLAYTAGTVAMAKSPAEPPGRSGSQFFVVTAPDAGLPPDFALLGEIVAGEETLGRIEELGDPAAGEEGTPLRPVVIERVELIEP